MHTTKTKDNEKKVFETKEPERRKHSRGIAAASVALVLSVSMLASPLSSFAASGESGEGSTGRWYDTSKEYHADVDYADMTYTGLDKEGDSALFDRLKEAVSEKKTDAEIKADLDELIERTDYVSTQDSLSYLQLCEDPNDDDIAEDQAYVGAYYSDIMDKSYTILRDMLKGPNAEAVKSCLNNERLVDELLSYEEASDRVKELIVRENELIQQYYEIMTEDVRWTYDSVEYDTASAYSAYTSKTIDKTTYHKIIGEIAKMFTVKAGPVYSELVAVRNEKASCLGYDNYAEYAYDKVYSRDYTTEDIKSVYSDAKEYFLPVYNELKVRFMEPKGVDSLNFSQEEIIERITPVIGEIDPELQEAWDYLVDHHLYDIEPDSKKNDMGFTTTLPSYGSEFIFYNSIERSYYDLKTMIHEFGHFNEGYHNNMHALYDDGNIDVCEIHSQGLELLSLEYADQLYGSEYAEDVRDKVLYSMCDSVLDGCVYDEFQNKVYSYEGKLDTDTINGIFREVTESYGDYYDNEELRSCDWVTVSHNFDSPMYYISYATSALSALDIFAMSAVDRQGAIDCYMDLTTYGEDLKYRELMKETGLPDIFEEGTVKDIAAVVENYINVDPSETETAASAFTDVAGDADYADAVAWAAANNITTGTSKTTFSPDADCTRAQFVTFLYRSVNTPEAGGDISFADVASDAYYAKAVAWAIANNITTGTSETTFGPDEKVSRTQAVTFMYRMTGTDAETTGIFGQGEECTRAQAVTLLYRAR